MKQGLILAAMLASSPVFSCMDFSGRWVCKNRDNASRDMEISQTGTEFTITNYGVGQPTVQSINADGKVHEYELDWSGQRVTANVVAYCLNNRVYETRFIPYENNQSRVLSVMNMVKSSDTSIAIDSYQDYGGGSAMYNWLCQKQ